MVVVVRDEADVVDAHIAFHLNAGVDFVVATDHASTDGTSDVLESYARDGYLRRISEAGEARDAGWRASMARLAIDEHGADWVLDSEADEFWLPRAESIKDVLVAIPPRYGIVQGLVRVFLPRPDDAGRFFAERLTVRRKLFDIREDESMGKLDWALRPIHRAAQNMAVGAERDVLLDGRVPLRAWYPVEVLRYPLRSLEQAESRVVGRSGPTGPRSRIEQELFAAYHAGAVEERWAGLVLDEDEVRLGMEAGSLVVDTRLFDAFARVQRATGSEAPGFSLPKQGSSSLGLPTPTVVDDVAYAGECAAVREVDFEPLQDRISELEQRIAALEARFWPRVRHRMTRLLRR